LKLLLDETFSPLVAGELRARGHNAVAIKERDEWQSLSDPEVIALARTEQRAVVTANLPDFRHYAPSWSLLAAMGTPAWSWCRHAPG
jgi:predicted nuclease of predicted toxin-antitoxin system